MKTIFEEKDSLGYPETRWSTNDFTAVLPEIVLIIINGPAMMQWGQSKA